jgi:hypothetical protein
MNKRWFFPSSAFPVAVITLQGCVTGGTDDAKFASTVTGKWQMLGGNKTVQFQPEATDWRPGAASISGKEYQYEFPDNTHIRFFNSSSSQLYQFQISGNQLILKSQSGKTERYLKAP